MDFLDNPRTGNSRRLPLDARSRENTPPFPFIFWLVIIWLPEKGNQIDYSGLPLPTVKH